MFGLASLMKNLKKQLVISLIAFCSSAAIATEATPTPAKREDGSRLIRRTLSNSEERLETASKAEEYLVILESIALCEQQLLERCINAHGEQTCTDAFKDTESELLKKYVAARLDRAKKAQTHINSASSKVRYQIAAQQDVAKPATASTTSAKPVETNPDAKK